MYPPDGRFEGTTAEWMPTASWSARLPRAVVRVWRSLRGFRGESMFGTWLHRVALNVIHSYLRREMRLRRLFPEAPSTGSRTDDPIERAPDPSDVEADVIMRDAIDKALAYLPNELRVAVTQRDTRTSRTEPRIAAQCD